MAASPEPGTIVTIRFTSPTTAVISSPHQQGGSVAVYPIWREDDSVQEVIGAAVGVVLERLELDV